MSEGLIFVISAPSGAGKTTICKAVVAKMENIFYSISYTTRSPRPGEKNGKDYYFISQGEFDKMVKSDMFLEYARLHDNCYGTGYEETINRLDKGVDVIVDIDSQGAMQLKERAAARSVFIYLLPPSLNALSDRLRKRQTDDENVISKRLNKAKSEIRNFLEYEYLVINDDLDMALEKIKSIILAEKQKLVRMDHKQIITHYEL